ncbi:MAG: hypothetical protein CBB68_08555 [Rhodospirillaceae bacterium TMED8]|nr:hypothetical protein [Magnetovibrio sp.]OUT50420.1 MAG: hypothetical protein CBB68_08555 [Rhodospirillaceae bacterium TMED8]|tara:strand:- start:322 stop:1005 length:684 start_codon:yes stop_codon:yes gene_type:complete
MISAVIRGIRQLSDPAAQRVLWLSVGITFFASAILCITIGTLLLKTELFEAFWLESVTDTFGGALTLVIIWLLFPSIISGVMGLLLDSIVEAVEAEHYHNLPKSAKPSLSNSLSQSAKLFASMVVINILLLPFIFLGPIFLFVYFCTNGYLLGREFFEMVASRRLPPEQVRAMRKHRQGALIIIGAFLTALMTIPIINLLTPIIATAAITHLFEQWRSPADTAITKS